MRLIKVELTYDDGTIKYLDDPVDIEKWENRINSAIALRFVHGHRDDQNVEKWKIKNK